MLLLFAVCTHSFVLHHHHHHHTVIVSWCCFGGLSSFLTIYLCVSRFIAFSHFRIYVSLIFFLLSLIGNFLFLPLLLLSRSLFWISPHIELYGVYIHTSAHIVCVCLCAIHSDCYLRIFTCAFLWLPLFSMTASIRGISAFLLEFPWVTKLFVRFQWFFLSLFYNCTEFKSCCPVE